MEFINNIQKLEEVELKNINGGSIGSHHLGFMLAAYVDFEIGVAIGIGRAISKAWNNL